LSEEQKEKRKLLSPEDAEYVEWLIRAGDLDKARRIIEEAYQKRKKLEELEALIDLARMGR
jgi:uncharacterized protein HemY